MISIETPRLLLRSYEYGDEKSIITLINSNKVHLKSVLSDWVYQIENFEQAQLFIKKMRVGTLVKNIFALGVWLKSENKLIGEIVLFKIDWDIGKMEIGSYIDSSYQGKGIITEAKYESIKYFFTKYSIKRIEAICHINNYASHRVIEKCGFLKINTESAIEITFYITPEMINN